MMIVSHGSIVVQRFNRTIAIQVVNDQTYYAALCTFGFKPSVAAAAAAKLITVSTKGSS